MDNLSYPLPRPAALEPPVEWAELRQRCPVARVRMPSGDEATLLTRYADVRQILSDTRFGRLLDAPDAARLSDTDSGGVFNSEMATVLPQTGPAHERWRRMISKWFTAKRMTALRPGIEAMANQLIDEMTAKGQPADLKADLAFPLPVWVICDLLGVPESDRDRFAHWSDSLLNLTRYTQQEMETAQREFAAYMAAHIAARRAEPGDDLLSELVIATDAEGRGLSDAELVATGQGLLIAGHETTANMIAKMTGMLLADRRRWERLLADRSLVRTAVEEALRFDANLGFGMVRYVDQDVEVGDDRITAGTTVVCDMAAANRDETEFADAAEMDLARTPNPHLTFGAGPHSCLGQSLARTELQTVLGVLLDRVPSLELAVPAEDLQRVEGLVVGGLSALPVRW
ncbi:cytochrome P450 [Kutzneria kofuensis]|uniref:Cytochrome P450 n=1 Tax=Kutzneria kofuensis TaxID=103725 RepID=A0A7W9KNS3_9PSEU|nr:cytochrome P450 [Kutzneria kofuensis]MBB5895952.1 cytochrome P450 [Kutzneria kofuensis]